MKTVVTRRCHYCQRGATEVPMTKDHIVPRYRVRALRLDGGHFFFGLNLVPACTECNGLKGYMARMCSCTKCWKAWDAYLVLKATTAPVRGRGPSRVSSQCSSIAGRRGPGSDGHPPEQQPGASLVVEAAAGYKGMFPKRAGERIAR